jgi:uncharacterized protein
MSGTTAERSGFWNRIGNGLAGTGSAGIIATIIILAGVIAGPPVAAVLVLLWLWVSRTPYADVGLKTPQSWAVVIVAGIIAGVALKLLMKAVVLPYFDAPAVNAAFQHLRALDTAIIESVAMIFLAGFAEEIVFRGFLLNRLQAFFGTSFFKRALMVLGSGLLFGVAHILGQGPWGVFQATLMGWLFATIYFMSGQRLWFLMIAHAAFDVAAVWIIYFGLEERIAHGVFG